MSNKSQVTNVRYIPSVYRFEYFRLTVTVIKLKILIKSKLFHIHHSSLQTDTAFFKKYKLIYESSWSFFPLSLKVTIRSKTDYLLYNCPISHWSDEYLVLNSNFSKLNLSLFLSFTDIVWLDSCFPDIKTDNSCDGTQTKSDEGLVNF